MVQMAEGNVTGAARTALEGATRLQSMATHRAQLLHLAVRLGTSPPVVLDGLTAIAGDAESELPTLQRDHVLALARQDAIRLEGIAERFDELGLWLGAAESAARAARLYGEAGRRTASARSSRRSRELADRCEGATTPGLRLAAPRQPLSRRETEVARLAAGGLSNAEIAARLVLSVRTVESHLYNVFAKTGVDQRDALTDALDS
jgi:DNA-binding CsgD family transcriptional regulator